MSSPEPLTDVLQSPVTSEARRIIVDHLWPALAVKSEQGCRIDWEAYFAYYHRQCTMALLDEGRHLCARNHEDIFRITNLLVTENTRPDVKVRIREILTQKRTQEDEARMLEGSVNLAARLLAMIDVGPLPSEISSRHALPWSEEPFYEAVHTYFDTPQAQLFDTINLGTDFTARNIERLAGIDIVWVDNLVDHLRLVDSDRKLCVFHHVSFLTRMVQTQSPIFPTGFAQETLETLMLLFPSSDRKAKRWLQVATRCESGSIKIDASLSAVGDLKASHPSRRLENLKFWRDRFGALSDAVDEATPPTKALLKALNDHKQSDRWLSSWVAIVAIALTLLFGLIQSIEGAIQVYNSYHSGSE